MPRNTKCRRVCAEPQQRKFTPEDKCEKYVILQVEELEALRLCDLEEMDQEKAANQMMVSRGTFQRILYSARKKSAEALCLGRGILIEGGNYEIEQCCLKCDKQCKSCTREVE